MYSNHNIKTAIIAIISFYSFASLGQNKLLTNQYNSQLTSAELPFYRFQLVFKYPISIVCLLVLFFTFILIIPFYIRALVSVDSNYAKLYKEEIKNRIVNEYELTKKDCSEILNKKYSSIKK